MIRGSVIFYRRLSSSQSTKRVVTSVGKEMFRGRVNPMVLTFPIFKGSDSFSLLQTKFELTLSDLRSSSRDRNVTSLNDTAKASLRSLLLKEDERLGYAETAKLLETLSSNMSLSESISDSIYIGSAALNRFGTPEQLSRFRSGIIASGIREERIWSDVSGSKTKAVRIENTDRYVLNGKKIWVHNASKADVFIVFADTEKGITAFLVPASSPGVSLGEKVDKVGLEALDTRTVTFTNVEAHSILGELGEGNKIYKETVCGEQRIYTSSRICSSLIHIFNETLKHAMTRFQFDKPLSEMKTIALKLAETASEIYALQSSIYFACVVAESQESQDIEVDATLCKIMANQTVQIAIRHCCSILGRVAYDERKPFNELARDLEAFRLWDGPNDILKCYVSLLGLEHAGPEIQESVIVNRNPLSYPKKAIAELIRRLSKTKWSRYKTQRFKDHVHYSLENAANEVENAVLNFKDVVEDALFKHGRDIQREEVELERIADFATKVYGMIAALSRLNGLMVNEEPNELEESLTLCYIENKKFELMLNSDFVGQQSHLTNDKNLKDVADYIVDQGRYPCVHPIVKNLF